MTDDRMSQDWCDGAGPAPRECPRRTLITGSFWRSRAGGGSSVRMTRGVRIILDADAD